MALLHKFNNYPAPLTEDYVWEAGYSTSNTILNTPYKPEVIFIGTFNHGWAWNPADFFYGRGMFMWPVLANLFLYKENHLTQARSVVNNNPTLSQIFEICETAKITFADIVKGTRGHIATEVLNNSILVNNEFTWSNYDDKSLDHMGALDWLDDNVDEIISYINETPSIKHVYFTFKSGGWVVQKKDEILNGIKVQDTGSILSPSGNGLGSLLPGYPNKLATLAHTWVWNNLHHEAPLNRSNFVNLDHAWLLDKGVNPNNF